MLGGSFAARLARAVMVVGWLVLGAASAVASTPRLALVIGNGAYVHAPTLPNPANDAKLMAQTLRGLGFEVIEGIDVNKQTFDEKVRAFARGLTTADTAVLFYAGHGLQVSGVNYLLPIDAKLDAERDLQFEATRSDIILQQMEMDREGKTNIVFLDACRDNPLVRNLARSMGTRSAGLGRGLAAEQSGVGSFISFSTQPGNVALDGAGKNSPFTSALSKHIAKPGTSLSALMIDVRKDVIAATGGKQVPWDHSALTGEFFFVPAAVANAAQQAVVAPTPSGEQQDATVTQLRERMRQLEEQLRAQSSMKPAPAAAAVASKSAPVGADGPAPAKRDGSAVVTGDCFKVAATLAKPVPVSPGTQLCADKGNGRAVIVRVSSYGVVFKTQGFDYETTCKPGDLCQFNWDRAPFFSVRIERSGDDAAAVRADLVPKG